MPRTVAPSTGKEKKQRRGKIYEQTDAPDEGHTAYIILDASTLQAFIQHYHHVDPPIRAGHACAEPADLGFERDEDPLD